MDGLLPDLRHKVDLLVRLSSMTLLMLACCASWEPNEATSGEDVRAFDAVRPASGTVQSAIAVLLCKLAVQLFNPPYVPTDDSEITKGGIAAAWAGGTNGRVVIDRLLSQVLRTYQTFFCIC